MRVFNSVLAAVAIAATLLATLTLLLVGMTEAADSLNLARNTDVYSVIFHLKRVHSEAEIDKAFWDIATPGNARYRQHLNKKQLRDLHAAPQAVISKTRDYLVTELGCSSVKQLETDDVLLCNLDKRSKRSANGHAQVDQAFANARPETFRTEFTSKLPLQIRKLVRAAVAYRTKLPKSKQAKGAANTQPGMTQTPYTINSRYNVPSSSQFPTLDPTVTAAVGEFEGEFFYNSDNTAFYQNYNLNPFNVEVMGANTPSQNADQVEGTLDIQYIGSVFNNTQPILWAEGGVNNNDPGEMDFTTWISKLLARSNIPHVVSISWGAGIYRWQDAGQTYLFAADQDAFRKAGLAGITLLAASGDSGVGVRQKTFSCDVFHPNWPSSSSYLTSVGATYADSLSEGEKAVNWSGGGFSTVVARPSYQEAAVSHYLRTNTQLPASSYYNASGRGYPDVSALGTNFNVFVQGAFQPISGTSAASPTFAGVLTLIAAERSANGQPRLGFLNPTIYALGKVGYDVTEGQNQDTNCIPGVPIEGFAAQKGWDPVSGLGTPDYQFLRANL